MKGEDTMQIKIINTLPRLVSRPQRGWWRITAHYIDGKVIFKDYYASNQVEAKYTFLVEHGRVRGTVDAVFLEKGNKILCGTKL
jgi:hypothetical protein